MSRTRLGTRLGRCLGTAARRLGVAPLIIPWAVRALRRLDPDNPALRSRP
jgi:hypothetical protein